MKIAALSGSTRSGSYNSMLVDQACKILKVEHGIDTTVIKLVDYPMPIYTQELESDHRAMTNVNALYEVVRQQDAFFIANPEYNGFFPPIFKNMIDWLSRKDRALFRNKVIALSSASIGSNSIISSIASTQTLMTKMQAIVIPQHVSIKSAHTAFTQHSESEQMPYYKQLQSTLMELVKFTEVITQLDKKKTL